MAKFSKIEVLRKMGETGMVPVYYHEDLETAKQVIKACYDGGVRAFEFTNRGDFAHEVFGALVNWADTACPELALGAGTVIDAPTAALYLQLGANFIKDLMAPLRWSKVMVTGGVAPTRDNLEGWFKAGAYCVGMGSKLFPKDVVAAKDWQYITDKCGECLEIIKEIRK